MKSVLMIVGSLRKNSFNLQLAKYVAERMSAQVEVRFLTYSHLPFMNQDIEFPVPQEVAAVRKAVIEADGVWFFSPEYNHQIPGVLKNLLDWLSRPQDPTDRKTPSAVRGKAATISGVAGKSAAAGVRKQLCALLEIMSMNLIAKEGTGVSLDAEAFQTGKLSLSDQTSAEIEEQMQAFLAAL